MEEIEHRMRRRGFSEPAGCAELEIEDGARLCHGKVSGLRQKGRRIKADG